MRLRKLTARKLASLKRDAGRAQMLRDKFPDRLGNMRYVFVVPNDLLESLRKYPST